MKSLSRNLGDAGSSGDEPVTTRLDGQQVLQTSQYLVVDSRWFGASAVVHATGGSEVTHGNRDGLVFGPPRTGHEGDHVRRRNDHHHLPGIRTDDEDVPFEEGGPSGGPLAQLLERVDEETLSDPGPRCSLA